MATKLKAAVELGKRRAEKGMKETARLGGLARMKEMTPKERRKFAAKGVIARVASVSPARRREIGVRAVQTRWARWRAANGKPPKPGDAEVLK